MAIKLQLNYYPEDDYRIIGISCHLKDYRLAYFLNQSLNFSFRKIENFVTGNHQSDPELSFSLYSFHLQENQVSFYLVANRCLLGYLIPEQKKLDYLIIINGVIDDEKILSLIKTIKEIPSVLTAFQLNLSKIKNLQKILNDFELFLIDLQRKETEQKKEMLKKIEKKKK